MPCPDESRWIDVDASPDREALLSHAESCQACRTLLKGAWAAGAPSHPPLPPALRAKVLPSRRSWTPWAAAAGLLVAALLAFRWPRPIPAPAPAVASAPAERVLGLGRSGSLVLSGDARISPAGEGKVKLEAGALLATARGDRVEVHCSEGVLSMAEGEAVVEIPARRPSLVREAGAAEGSVAIRILSGTAQWGERTLRAGDAIGSPSFSGGWSSAPGTMSGAYAWEALMKRPDARTGVTLRLPAGGRSWDFPVDEALLGEPGRWVRIGATVGGGWLRVEVAGREAGVCPLSALARRGTPAEGEAGPALRPWGPGVEIRGARWRSLK